MSVLEPDGRIDTLVLRGGELELDPPGIRIRISELFV
jgi:hypothetical protein